MPTERPDISVVIPCFRARSTLPALFESLNRQTLRRDRFEVIVVDDGSDDGTCEYLSTVTQIKLLKRNHRGPGEARNTGFDAAKAELVLYLDSDLVAQEELLMTHLKFHLANPDVAASGGAVIPAEKYRLFSWALVDHLCSWFNAHPAVKYSAEPEYLPSLNFCVKKSTLSALGPLRWRDGLKVTGEDVVFCSELRKSGLHLAFLPQAAVRHRDRADMRGYLRHMWRWGEHAVFVRGASRNLKYSFLFPKQKSKLVLTMPFMIAGYTALIWLAWFTAKPFTVTLSLPQILLGRIAYAWGVWAGANKQPKDPS